jgi:hypothetical protein
MPSQDVDRVVSRWVKSVTPKVAAPRRRHLREKLPVAERGRPVLPVPSTMGSISPRPTSGGKMATLAVVVEPAGVTDTTVVTVDVPRLDIKVSAFWWTMSNRGVGAAHEAEGHVSVARLRSTTLSARHQDVNRWDIAVTGYLRMNAQLGAVTFFRSDFLHERS